VLFRPPPDAVEVLPGLFTSARIWSWNGHKGERRPGKPFDELSVSEGPSFGVTVLFFPEEGFAGGEVRYREELTLPSAPKSWDDVIEETELPDRFRPRQTISPDGRTCVIEHVVPFKPGQMIPNVDTDDGFVILSPFPIHTWGLSPSDPVGTWTIKASINGKPIAQKAFVVRPGARPDPAVHR
jgi:hypothetical protein